MSNITREQLNAWARELDLDLVGVAAPERFRAVAPPHNPLAIMPEARAIVVFAREIPRSYFRGIEEGTLWMRVNRYLPPLPSARALEPPQFRVHLFLESHGLIRTAG